MSTVSDALDHALDAFQDEVYESFRTAPEIREPPQPAEYTRFCKECHAEEGGHINGCVAGSVEGTLLRIQSLHE